MPPKKRKRQAKATAEAKSSNQPPDTTKTEGKQEAISKLGKQEANSKLDDGDKDTGMFESDSRINKIMAEHDHSATKILCRLLVESKQEPKGPWHVIQAYYKHGEIEIRTHTDLVSLLKEMKTAENHLGDLDEDWVGSDEDEDDRTDTLAWTVADWYDDFTQNPGAAHHPDYLERMIVELIDKTHRLTETQSGWRWAEVIVGGIRQSNVPPYDK